MLLLTNVVTHSHVLSVPFIEYGLNVNEHDISFKAIFGEMREVYVTYVDNADKEQHSYSCMVLYSSKNNAKKYSFTSNTPVES